MKRSHVCAAQTTYLFLPKLNIEPDFPSLADEIAEPRPDMNIKVTAFTVSKKSINTCKQVIWQAVKTQMKCCIMRQMPHRTAFHQGLHCLQR